MGQIFWFFQNFARFYIFMLYIRYTLMYNLCFQLCEVSAVGDPEPGTFAATGEEEQKDIRNRIPWRQHFELLDWSCAAGGK